VLKFGVLCVAAVFSTALRRCWPLQLLNSGLLSFITESISSLMCVDPNNPVSTEVMQRPSITTLYFDTRYLIQYVVTCMAIVRYKIIKCFEEDGGQHQGQQYNEMSFFIMKTRFFKRISHFRM
jgi:hypothetical protein